MLVDQQWNWRENQALDRRMKAAKLRGNACIEDIDFRASRGLDKSVIRALATGIGVGSKAREIFVLGPTDLTTFCTPLPHD